MDLGLVPLSTFAMKQKLFKKPFVRVLLSLGTVFYAAPSFGWGHVGHETLAEIGSSIVGSQPGGTFWLANAANMGVLTNVPDDVWKQGPDTDNEKPTHWFQVDSYFTNVSLLTTFPRAYNEAVSQYTETTVIANGTAPWRVQQFYNLAVAALKKGNFAIAVEMAGAMSHYIGDMSQPLHVAANFDGDNTGDPGIHKFFETDNLLANQDSLADPIKAQALANLSNPAFLAAYANLSPENIAFVEVSRAFPYSVNITTTDNQLGRGPQGSQALLNLAIPRLAEGAAVLSLVLSKLWVDGGSPKNGATASVGTPSWIAPNFGNLSSAVPVQVGPASYTANERNGMALTYDDLHKILDRDDCEK